jgi:hypothetical protein
MALQGRIGPERGRPRSRARGLWGVDLAAPPSWSLGELRYVTAHLSFALPPRCAAFER